MSKNSQSDIWDDEKFVKIEKVLATLSNDRHKKFVEHYCRYLSKKQAALYAGYSEKNANRVGWALHTIESVREAISEILKITAVRPEDNVSGLRRIAELNLADYFTVQRVWEERRIRVPLDSVIQRLRDERDIEEDILLESLNEKPIVKAEILGKIRSLERRITRLEKQFDKDPSASVFEYETVQVAKKVLNMEKVVADNVPIKSVKYKETGIEVEFYSVIDARNTIAKIDGSFEAHNKQLAPLVNNNLTITRISEISKKLEDNV